MQEFAITNDKTKRPVALRTKTLADLLECTSRPVSTCTTLFTDLLSGVAVTLLSVDNRKYYD